MTTPRPPLDSTRGVYSISTASEISGIPAATIRLYETHGILTPARSDGGTRKYSQDDIDRMDRTLAITNSGINLAGVSRILQLEDENSALRGHTE
jgi:MerR family transcriptional regulator, heat shock protein HspR